MPKNITEAIREVAERSMPSLSVGRVLRTDPLMVQLHEDAAIRLSAQSLVIPSGKLPLQVGEDLYLLVMNHGKLYYVLDRV